MNADSGKEQQEISFENSRYIRCPDCGEEIMMAPVLSQMIEAIENHIATHKIPPEHDAHLDCELKIHRLERHNIEDDLAGQVLQRAAEISDALGKNQTWINQE